MDKQKSIEALQFFVTHLAEGSIVHKQQGMIFKSQGFSKLGEKYIDHFNEEMGWVEKFTERILDLGGEVKFEGMKERALIQNPIEYVKADLEIQGPGVELLMKCMETVKDDPITYDHCAEGVTPDPTPHIYSAPDNRALYTIYTPLAWIEKEGEQDGTYTVSDQLLAVFANDNSLWCKDLGDASNVFTQPATATQHDYLRDLLGRTTDWDQSNWVELHFDDATDLSSTLKGYEGYYIKPATITGTLTDKRNYRIEVDRPLLYLEDTTLTYIPNVYCAANFLESNLVLNEGDTGAPSELSPNLFYYFLNPKVQEYALISIVMWDGQNFVLPEKEIGSNVHNFHGCFSVVWDYNMFGDQHENLNTYTQYEFRAIIRRAAGSTYGPAYAPQSGQQPSENIVVYPIDLKDTSIVTSVGEVKAASVTSVKYVSPAGLVSDRPFDGMNIVVTEYSDGSRTTAKQLR